MRSGQETGWPQPVIAHGRMIVSTRATFSTPFVKRLVRLKASFVFLYRIRHIGPVRGESQYSEGMTVRYAARTRDDSPVFVN